MVLIVCHSPLTTTRRSSAFVQWVVPLHSGTESSELGILSAGPGAVTGARVGTKSSSGSSRAPTRYFTARKPNTAVASSSPVSVRQSH